MNKRDTKSIKVAKDIFEERYRVCAKEIEQYKQDKTKLEDMKKSFDSYLTETRWNGMAPCTDLAYINGTSISTEFYTKVGGSFNVLTSPQQSLKYLDDTSKEIEKLQNQYEYESVQLLHRMTFLDTSNNMEDQLVNNSKGLLVFKDPYVEIIEFEDEPVDPFRKHRISHCFTNEEKLKYIAGLEEKK